MKKYNIHFILYFVGLALYLLGLLTFFGLHQPLFANVLYSLAIVLAGYQIVWEGFEKTYEASRKHHRFYPNIHLLMSLGAIGAVLIGNFGEGALLIMIFAGANFLEEYSENRSRREITSLLEMNPVRARKLMANGAVVEVAVEEVQVGDKVQVLNGGQVPIDGEIISGQSTLDEAVISGESIPLEKGPGDEVFAGTINGEQTLVVRATKDNSETVFAKILQMVQQSQDNVSKTASLIERIEPRYVTTVLILFPIVILIGYFGLGWAIDEAIYRGIIFLIAASPCALAASAIPATLAAMSNLARKGVLFKGGSYLTSIAELKAVAFDKTGTLTQGKPVVTDFFVLPGENEDTIVNVIVGIERSTNHPLANAIVNHFEPTEQLDLAIETKVGKGVTAQYADNDYAIGKPTLFAEVDPIIEQERARLAVDGKTVVYVAMDDRVVALIAMMDLPSPTSADALAFLQAQGVETVMLTGDAKETGQAVGRKLGIDTVITNVLPEDKVTHIQKLKQEYAKVGMVGDGVNDAPALVNADIGVAMGDGTDVAIDVADVVLMKNDLEKFAYSYRVSKRLNRIVWQNIIFALSVVLIIIVLNFLQLTNIGLGVFMHEGSTILVILNGLRLLADTK